MSQNILRIEGNTFPYRDEMRRLGYKWDATTKTWWRKLHADAVAGVKARDKVWMKDVLKCQRPGCRATLDGEVVFTSKTYAQPKSVLAGDVYACDAAGNYCGGPVIPGSAPDDLMW